MKTNKDYVGERINEWLIEDFENDEKGGKWLCKCKCGYEKWQQVYNIKYGTSKMCKKCSGKLRRKPKKEKIIERKVKGKEEKFVGTYKEYVEYIKKCREEEKERKDKYRGLSYSRIYGIYGNMKYRCNNKNDDNYKNYGGRGIKVCKEWEESFIAFYDWAMANGYKDTLTIDRIDVNGNYEPNNCRWVTNKEQQRNKRTNVFIEYKGKRQTLVEWSEELCIGERTISDRLRKGLPLDLVFSKDRIEREKKPYEETLAYQKERKKYIRRIATILRWLKNKKIFEKGSLDIGEIKKST